MYKNIEMVWSSATELNSIAKVKWIFKTNLVEIQQRFTYFRHAVDKLCMSTAVKKFSLVGMVSITIKFKTILGVLGHPYSCCFSSIFHLVLGTHFSVFWHNSLVGIFSVHAQFSCSVMSDFATPWIAASQASLSITNSQGLLKLMSIELVVPSDHLILCRPLLLLPQSFPTSGSFQTSQFFTSGGQRIGLSASMLSMNIQDWFPLGWTGWISLQSKGLSRVFSNTTVQKHQFFCTQLSL